MRERWLDALDNRQCYRKYKGQVCLCKSLRMLILEDWGIKRRQWRKAHQLHSSFVFIYLRKGERKKREGGDLYRSWQFPSFCVYVILIYLWIFFSERLNQVSYFNLELPLIISLFSLLFSDSHDFNCRWWAVRARSMNYHLTICDFWKLIHHIPKKKSKVGTKVLWYVFHFLVFFFLIIKISILERLSNRWINTRFLHSDL